MQSAVVGPRLACLFALLCLFSAFSHAQTTADQDLTSLSIEELTQLRISTASRHLEDPRKAPSSVTVISAEEITRYGWRTVGDILRSVRGFYTAYDRNYEYVGVRGFLQSGDYNARFLLMINGHRVNENIYDSALIGTEFPLDIDLIDHVEIVHGPSSSLYGTNAELAVINLITRQPATPEVEVAASTASYLSRKARLTASLRRGDFSGLFSGSIYRSNGVSRLYYPEFDTPENNNGIAQNVDGDRFDQGFADLQLGKMRVQGLYSSRLKIIPTAPYETNFNDSDERTRDTRAYVDARYHQRLGSETELDLRGYYDAYRFWGSYPYGGTGASQRTVQINDGFADWLGLEGFVSKKLGRHRIVVGGTGEYNARMLQRNYYLGQPPFLDDSRHPSLLAAFAEAELNFAPQLTVNVGLRVDRDAPFASAVSPRIAVMYLPTERTSLKYVLGHAFRAPDAYDLFYVDQQDITAPSKDLQPETIDSHALILDHRLLPWLNATVVGFFSDLHKEIEESVDATGSSYFANGGGDLSYGVDSELRADSRSGWMARASYSFVKTRERENSLQVMNAPSHLAKLNGTVPLSRYAFVSGEVFYTGVQQNYLRARIASSLLTNATFSTRPLWGGWQFSLSAYNLLDRRWYTPTGPELTQKATEQDGRNLRFKISYRLPIRSLRGRP